MHVHARNTISSRETLPKIAILTAKFHAILVDEFQMRRVFRKPIKNKFMICILFRSSRKRNGITVSQ